jgi:hypothetical protein
MDFYNRFNNNKTVEPFSNDVVYTSFNKTDAEYVAASGCTANSKCPDNPIYANDYNNCLCEYKNKVDKLTKLKDTNGASQKNLDDNGEIYSSITMDTINLGIGISIMLGTIYYMNQ